MNGSLLHEWLGSGSSWFWGSAIADAGDVEGDGLGDLLVASYLADPGGLPNAGMVVVYSGADGAPLLQWLGEQGESFGWTVSGAGDIDGDGHDDLLIGNIFADPKGLFNAGTVDLYSGADGSLLHQWEGLNARDQLGQSVAGDTDLNADGLPDIIMGAFGADPGGARDGGSAFAYSFFPYLSSNSQTISASSGATIQLEMDFPTAASSFEYKTLISLSGRGPSLYGIAIPLTQDSLARDTFQGNYPFPLHAGMHGTLDLDGNASASFSFPAGLSSNLIGTTLTCAAIANQPGLLPEYSSVAVSITITP